MNKVSKDGVHPKDIKQEKIEGRLKKTITLVNPLIKCLLLVFKEYQNLS